MSMTVKAFYARFKSLQEVLKKEPDAPDSIKSALSEIGQTLKAVYTADAFKQALADNAVVESDLEERLTSALIMMNQYRTKKGAG